MKMNVSINHKKSADKYRKRCQKLREKRKTKPADKGNYLYKIIELVTLWRKDVSEFAPLVFCNFFIKYGFILKWLWLKCFYRSNYYLMA